MILLLLNALTFLAVFLAVFAANALLVDLHSPERKRRFNQLEERMRTQQRERAQSSASRSEDFSKIAAEARADTRQDQSLKDRVKFFIEQSGLEITVSRLTLYSVLCGLAMATTGYLLSGSLMLAALASLFGAAIPGLYVQLKRHQRLEKLRSQLPDAFELISRVLRAGQTISQAMKAVADEFSPPLALEFLYCYEQMNLGLSPEAALRELGRRTGLLEIKIFVLSVVVHRQTGGNLAELLDKLSHVVRERSRIRGMIGSLTAQGRFQAMILLSLPPFMFALLMVLEREYEMTLLQYPMMIVAALTMMGLGALWIRRIVNFDF